MATNNPFAIGSQAGGKSAFGGGFKPPAGFGMPPMGVGRGNFPQMGTPPGARPLPNLGTPPMGVGRGNFPGTAVPGVMPGAHDPFEGMSPETRARFDADQAQNAAQAAAAGAPMIQTAGVSGPGGVPVPASATSAVPASAMSPDQMALMNSQQMFAANQAKLQAGQANQAAVNQTAQTANMTQSAANSQAAMPGGVANATAQLPEASAEMQTRARLSAAQPNTGAGPGNPTYSNNNQPGQPSGLISGQMQNRRAI